MADEKTGRKPDEEGGVGAEKNERESSEAGGPSSNKVVYTCWRDGAGNYIHNDWSWFTCWRCGALNYK